MTFRVNPTGEDMSANMIDSLGYGGWMSCEYRPRGDTVEGLGWARPYGIG